ncbi:hypothetical protein KSC_068820 [Ktedonobacter sp. SOSP1-52]|uniref:class I SAM-dependent methyltransferase n=1 Tax=Ktedonobacter sp. SOSP1-52 TaxID=2778366 RepID=UPI0019163094|nr:class I SAM-dependent methyltransferase [Ktedonobacter sp. SOSP1-52]GHO67990.1 hypothetical protein KSC_068820 [Ktedonobacter sp. SOSP1-52]
MSFFDLFTRLFRASNYRNAGSDILASSVIDHTRTEEWTVAYVDGAGRRRRTDVPYLLPKDDQEIQRLDYQHYILRQVLQGNISAPFQLETQQGYVLDVGCGSGRWASEVATSYPHLQVIGLDLEEANSKASSRPLNYQFTQGNVLEKLPFPDESMTYVHQRLLVAAIPAAKWPWVVQELARVTRRGGWVELVEMGGGFVREGAATQQFMAWFRQLSQMRGIDLEVMGRLDVLLQQAGLHHVQKKTLNLPVGSWGGRMGELLARDMLSGWPSLQPLCQQYLNIPKETFDAVIASLEAEWNSHQTEYEVYVVYGQK